jgi:hypothetical protein
MNGSEAHRSQKPALRDRITQSWREPGLKRSFLMKKFSKKGVLLFGGVLAVCAFAAPMASAASWAVVGTPHTLASANLSFTAGAGTGAFVGSSCADSEFTSTVASAANLEITAAAFRNCRGLAGTGAAGCTVTATGTGLPWTATARLTTDIQIHNVNVDVTFETAPPVGSTPCAAEGIRTVLTGTLTGGTFDPSSVLADRRVTFNHAPGLSSHLGPAGTIAAFVTGAFRDTQATLNVLD